MPEFRQCAFNSHVAPAYIADETRAQAVRQSCSAILMAAVARDAASAANGHPIGGRAAVPTSEPHHRQPSPAAASELGCPPARPQQRPAQQS